MKMTPKELRIAERVVARIETRIRERIAACPYCEQGSNAYSKAEDAVREAFKDVRSTFYRIENERKNQSGGITKADTPCHVHISEISGTDIEDQVSITISGMDGQHPYVGVVMSHEAFGKVIAGNGLQPATMTRWNGS